MVGRLTISGGPGSTVVSDSRLAYIKRIVKVQREGVEYDPDYTGTPAGRQYYHSNISGSITFDTPFGPVQTPITIGAEKVSVIYETL